MSKNMTRKGLAIGSAAALALAGITASPAMAADSITTTPGAGTSYITLDDQGVAGQNAFTLSTVMSPGLAGGNDATLHYLISNPEGATLDIQLGDTTNADPLSDLVDLDGDGAGAVGDVFDTATNTDQNSGEAVSLTSFVVVPAGDHDGLATKANAISIASDRATTITVTAWLDTAANATNAIDSVEIVGETRTIQFLDKTDVTWSSSFVGFTPADTVLEGRLTASPALNGNYVDAEDFTLKFTREGATGAITTSAGNWSNITNSWEFLNANNDEASLARADENWVGLPSVYQVGLVDVTSNANEQRLTLDTDADLQAGDVVTIVGVEAGINGDLTVVTYANKILTVADNAHGLVANTPDSTGYIFVKSRLIDKMSGTKSTATVFTDGEHGLSVGDTVTVAAVADANGARAQFNQVDATVTGVPTANSFTYAFATAQDAAFAEIAAAAGTVTLTSYDEVVPGNYTVQAYLGGSADANKIGAKVTAGSVAAAAATVSVAATASASVTGNTINSDDATDTGDILVKAGAAGSADIVATVYDADGDAVGAGRPVAYALSNLDATVSVNGARTGGVVNTDANGQVTFTVASTTGANGQGVTITLTPEGNSDADAVVAFDVDWVTQAFDVYNLNVSDAAVVGGAGNAATMTMVEGGSMVMDLRVLDQWYQAPAAGTYSVVAAGEGVADASYPATSSGVQLTVADSGVYDADMVFTLSLYKGTALVGTANTITVNLVAEGKVTLAADASSIYAGATADLSVAVAKAALVEIDTRTSDTVAPAYVNNGVITGKVVNKGTSASLEGAAVTLSGPSNVLFTNGAVSSRGSITVLTNSSGEFSVETRSTTAQTGTVITVSSLGGSATTKITFTGLTAGEATTLTVTAPAAVKPASTFQVKAKLTDALGNAVDTGDVMKVTYTGPGIIFGTLPTETDANGELSFSVLLGSNDTGTVSVTVSYDQNGDADYVDAKDLNTSASIAITATGTVPSADQKVNAGSFKGYVALYAKGYAGQRMSAKVGNDWVVVPVLASNFERVVEFTGAGYTVAVRIYIDRVLIDTITVTTK